MATIQRVFGPGIPGLFVLRSALEGRDEPVKTPSRYAAVKASRLRQSAASNFPVERGAADAQNGRRLVGAEIANFGIRPLARHGPALAVLTAVISSSLPGGARI